jgi:hypothetical protein
MKPAACEASFAALARGIEALEQILGVGVELLQRRLQAERMRAVARHDSEADRLQNGIAGRERGVV